MNRITLSLLLILFLCTCSIVQAQDKTYDESQVPAYTLPDPLQMEDGSTVTEARQWPARRDEILTLFAEQMYGTLPPRPATTKFKVRESALSALSGLARRKQVRVFLGPKKKGPFVDLLIYLPRESSGPVPVFVGLNFKGNHTVHADPEILLPETWLREDPDFGVTENRANEAGRGKRAHRWQVEMILKRGYGLVTAYYGDIDPDYDDGFQNGVHPLFYKKGQTTPNPEEWGSVAAWAWGLSRAMDYLEKEDAVDAKKVIVLGHSRLGKASLWAGATDPRFAGVISNDSGCGGAALSRREFGERVQRINTSFPHWFCDNFLQYNDKESTLPFDQHQLIALMAPRPVLVCSAEEDKWADPKGEFLSCVGAAPVYELLETGTFSATEMPKIHSLIDSKIGYHIRAGKHDVTEVDWKVFIDFMDKWL